jgi:hypothetical protein
MPESAKVYAPKYNGTLPEPVDWVASGAVNAVKDQG